MRLTFYIAILSLMLQFAAIRCRGQYYFKHYQVEDGLVHNSVMSLFQDSEGLIWIGTRGGLSRFDGYSFKTFRNPSDKLGTFGNNVITVITEDKNKVLWIGTDKGIFKYDPYSEEFTELQKAPESYIRQILVDSQNNLWFLADYSLYKFDQHTHKVEDMKMQAFCLAIDRNMDLWMGNDNGVISIYNIGNRSIRNVRIVDRQIPENMRSISKIYPVNDQLVLVGCFKQGLKSYNPKTGLVKSLPLQNSENADIYVRDITAEDSRRYWIATESGIYIYDFATNTSKHLKKKLGDPYSLADNAVYTICRDSHGDMWAGTYFSGLSYFSKENARFEKFYPIPDVNAISGAAIGGICPDNSGNLWIGTEDAGINKFNLKTGKFTNYTVTGKKEDISYPNIHGLLAVGNQLFIGPFFHGMEIMDTRTGKITDRYKFIGDKNDQVSDFALCYYLTRDSTLLVGTAYRGSGLFSYDTKQKTFRRIPQIPHFAYVFHITEDTDGNIWTGSVDQGAFFYNPKTGHSGHIRFGVTVKKRSLNEYPVRDICEDSNHAIWFATEGGGLIRLDRDHKNIKRFTTANGLSSNVIFCMLEDNSKHLWVSSLRGLICFDLRTEKCKTYTQSNGLITDQFNFNSAYKDAAGKMYFGSVKGLIAFDPSKFDQRDTSPPTYITGFQINNKEITPSEKDSPLKKSILFTDSVVLTHAQNSLSIEFAALNYSSAKVTRYQYCMKGLDKAWTYLNTNRKAYFTGLAPGNYVFIVRAESNIGNWTGKERRLFITILPPFWKSNIAYAVYAIILIGAFYVLMRYYHRYMDRKNSNKLRLFEHEKEKEIYQFKIDFFTNITHEIQTPLTLIVAPVERLLKRAQDQPYMKKGLLMVQKHADRLNELTSQLLDFRKTEMEQFGLNFVNVNINKLLAEQIEAFAELSKKSRIVLNLEMPETDIVAFVDREAFIKICSNLISNAIKYAASYANVNLMVLKPGDEQFTISFNNDGKGIPHEFRQKIFEPFFRVSNKERPGSGIGLSLAKSLTELHNGTLKLVSGEAKSTVFIVRLPIRQKLEFNLSTWKKIK